MSRIKINKNDVNRVLISDMLPYEVPMLFSNDGFYDIVSKDNIEYFRQKIGFSKYNFRKISGKYGLPFDFEISKNIKGETRALSIIHPLIQVSFVEFYEKYDSLIIHQCSKSPFSLRRPTKVAKYYYSPKLLFEDDDELKGPDVEIEPETLDKETRVLKSYFTYKPIDLVHKFYERNDYIRLEQRFNYLYFFDINKCFYNIYTHSISWAVKDKENAKRNAKYTSFENHFDKLMQLSNYNETNGIVVGPEVSRIFAEIILQQIDINILNNLTKQGLKIGVDYEIRRYVDDYFVFSNNKEILLKIYKIAKYELQKYKLYVNEAKSNIKEIPFITEIAVAKNELNHLLESFLSEFVTVEYDNTNETKKKVVTINKIRNIFGTNGLYLTFVKDFQSIIKRNNLTYDILSKDVIRKIKSYIIKIIRYDELNDDKNNIEKLLLLLLEIVFYSYSLNITSTSTFKVTQIIVLLIKFLKGKDNTLKNKIYSKIKKESDFVISIFNAKSKNIQTNIEILNLLIALKQLDNEYLLSNKRLKTLFNIETVDDYYKLNYFQIIVLLYYIENNSDYNDIKFNIVSSVIKRFENEYKKYDTIKDVFIKTELFLLFFDFINCPFIEKESKEKLLEAVHYCNKNKLSEEINKITTHKVWFMNWNEDINLERVLKKKEWHSTY